MIKDLLNSLGVNLEVYEDQNPAEQSKVLILVIGLLLSPIISGVVFGTFTSLLFQSATVGWLIGLAFGTLMFFFDRSFLEPVKDRALYIRFALSLVMGLVFSLGIKYVIFEDTLEKTYVKEIEQHNAQIYQDYVIAYEEGLVAKKQTLQSEISEMARYAEGQRRIEQRGIWIMKQQELDSLVASIPGLVEQRKESISHQYLEANTTPLGLLGYLIETLIGRKGTGTEWVFNILLLFTAIALESWAFIGAIVLRDGEYMREVEAIKLHRDEERNRRIELRREVQQKQRVMDQMIMSDDSSIPELRKQIVLTALKKEYAELTRKEHPTREDRQRIQEIIDELEELSDGQDTPFAYQSGEDALEATLKEFRDPGNGEDSVPPEFTYEN